MQNSKNNKNAQDNDQNYLAEKEAQNIKNWLLTGIDDTAIEFCDKFGKKIVEGKLTTSQIRIIFGELRRIEMRIKDKKILPQNEKTTLLMLRPKLAYAVKRHNNEGIKEFNAFFKIAYDTIVKNNNFTTFNNLMLLFEGILAFHKYYGGKE